MKHNQFKDRFYRNTSPGIGKMVRRLSNKKLRQAAKRLLDDAPKKVQYTGYFF